MAGPEARAARWTALSPTGYRQFPWKNGLGVTTDIAEARRPDRASGDWSGVLWRLGRTSIAQSGPFSDLGGFDRWQVVIAGSGLVLATPAGEVDLRSPWRPVCYPGEGPIMARLDDGPVEVVNLIADRSAARIELVALSPGSDVSCGGAISVIHAAAGPVTFTLDELSFTLAHDHALRIEPGAHLALTLLGGRALLARIEEL
jgi:uncharacterized protein